jgi:hypothetical protein
MIELEGISAASLFCFSMPRMLLVSDRTGKLSLMKSHWYHVASMLSCDFLCAPGIAHLLLSHASLNIFASLSASASSLVLCMMKCFMSLQNSSVATTSFPLGPCAAGACSALVPANPFSASLGGATAGGLVTGVDPVAGEAAVAPPITITPNSTSPLTSCPITSATVLLSVTGFFLYSILILAAGMEVCVAYRDLRS